MNLRFGAMNLKAVKSTEHFNALILGNCTDIYLYSNLHLAKNLLRISKTTNRPHKNPVQ